MATINHKTYNEATETFKDFSVYDGKETLIFKVDGSEGNVGIGTSSPTDTIGYGRALDIQSSTGAVVYLRDSNAPTTQYGFLAFDGTDNGLKLHNANSSGFLRFDTNATERLRITSAGNVGIGNSSPPTSFALGSSTTGLSFTSASSSLNSGKIAVLKQVEIGSGNGDLTIETYAGGAGGGERMRITSTGNVGIGTSSPQGNLDVKGSANVAVFLRNASNGDTNTDGLLLGNVGGIPASYQIWNYENGFLRFGTNAEERMRITSTGQVLIGTSSAQSGTSLQVAGVFDVWNSSNTLLRSRHDGTLGLIQAYTGGGVANIGINTEGGKVGIGTSTPSEKLEVDGNLQLGTTVDAKLYMLSTGGNGNNERFYIEGYADGGTYGGGFKLYTRDDANIFNNAVTVNRNGLVGIGTSNPVAKLESLDGDIKVTTQSAFAGFITSRNTIPSSGGTQLGRLQYSAYSTGTTYVDGAAIQAFSTEAWSASSTPSWLSLQTVASGSTSLVERVRIDSDGLKFNGDTAAANALDDYEEGTFTATLSPSDSGSISLSAATCTYTKIGRQVVVKGLIAISSVSTPVGASVTIGGLPFTIINSTAGRGSFSVVILDASASYTAATYPTQHTLNATSLIVYVNASTIEPNDEIMFTATYFV
jgi:hypothetical protein